MTRSKALQLTEAACQQCYKCPIRIKGHPVVYGYGNPEADLIVIGEAPGYNEHISGIPFTGKAGKLADKMLLQGMGYSREEIYTANILKCRPPDNRNPSEDEINNCVHYLDEQISIIEPKVILCLGKFAGSYFHGRNPKYSTMKDMFDSQVYLSLKGNSIPVFVTWHPAYLLRNPTKSTETQKHLNKVLNYLKKPILIEI